MSYQRKDGQGALFQNDKRGNSARPDWRGDVLLNGVEYEIAAWDKQTRGGKDYLSLSVKPKQARQERQQPQSAPPNREDGDPGFGDDGPLPF